MAQVERLQATQGYRENPSALIVTSVSMCVCWVASYIGMVYKSFQDRTYCMPLMPLCCDLAFEFIFSVISPPKEDPILQYVFASWLACSVVVVFATMKFAPNEWKHAPLIQQNIFWIFTISIISWMAVHLALVAQFGPDDGVAWSACLCQLLLSASCLCQLIVQGSSRGASLFIWYVRELKLSHLFLN
jgi:paspaline synthase